MSRRGGEKGQRRLNAKRLIQMAARAASSHEEDIELTRKIILNHFTANNNADNKVTGIVQTNTVGGGRLGKKKTLIMAILVAIVSYIVVSGVDTAVVSSAIWRCGGTIGGLAVGWVKNLRWAPQQGAI